MARLVASKSKYTLTMTSREKQRTIQFIAGCAAGKY